MTRPAGPPAAHPVEAILGHVFARPDLLREALTHRSLAGRRGGFSNERLEFLGDRVLGLLVAEWLSEAFPREQEGALGKRLAHLVSQPVLARIAEEIGLAAAIVVAPGEAKVGVKRRATVLSDALEAVLGALYLDGGLAPTRDFVRRAWAGPFAELTSPPSDAKTRLQEWAQARGAELPVYTVIARSGPPHAPEFVVAVRAAGRGGQGSGGSKRAAEQAAAADLLAGLEA